MEMVEVIRIVYAARTPSARVPLFYSLGIRIPRRKRQCGDGWGIVNFQLVMKCQQILCQVFGNLK